MDNLPVIIAEVSVAPSGESFRNLHSFFCACFRRFTVGSIKTRQITLWAVRGLITTNHDMRPIRGPVSNLEYPERLKKLNLTTLVCRRARGDMLETFKYLNGQYNSAPILHLDSRTRGTTTRGHQLKLEKGRSRLDVRKHFFTQRVVNLWNALPVNLVSAPTVNAFKNRLDTLWKDAPFTTDPNAPNIYYTLY